MSSPSRRPYGRIGYRFIGSFLSRVSELPPTESLRDLGIIRVYTKAPQQKQEEFKRGAPSVLPQGSTVADASAYVQKDLVRSLKYAVLWGRSGKFEGQHVGRDHRLHDGDLIELHT